MLDITIELIHNVPVFRRLSQSQLSAVLRITTKVFFEPGEKIICEDEFGDTSYLITSGFAVCPRFVEGHWQEERLGPGTLVGELAMLVDTVHNFTITARDRVRALAITRERLRKVMKEDPAIADRIADYLVGRLRDLASVLRAMDEELAEVERSARSPHQLAAAGHAALRRLANLEVRDAEDAQGEAAEAELPPFGRRRVNRLPPFR